jgi:HPt (histidine-containing phosphotransfer) domain-containing protein
MSDDLISFPIMDYAIIADLREVMAAKFPDLVRILLCTLPLQLTDIYTAVAQGDADALYRTAHKLKSGTGSIGALQLSELARRLEAMGRSGNLADVTPLLEQTRITAEHTRASFQSLLDS